jgi:hypothetical protein
MPTSIVTRPTAATRGRPARPSRPWCRRGCLIVDVLSRGEWLSPLAHGRRRGFMTNQRPTVISAVSGATTANAVTARGVT